MDVGYKSPLAGDTVTITGVITGLDDRNGSTAVSPSPGFPEDRGFFVQEEDPDIDTDPNTSEGVFVGNVGNLQLFALGDLVSVTGQVVERFGQTQVNGSTSDDADIIVHSTGNPFPSAVPIVEADAEAQATNLFPGPGGCAFPTDHCRDGRRALYERLEGMRVSLPAATVNSGGTNRFGELFVNPGSEQNAVFTIEDSSGPGGTPEPLTRSLIGAVGDAGAGNPANPQIDWQSTTNVFADQFDQIQSLTGPLSFSASNYKIVPQAGALPTVVEGPTPYPFSGVSAQPANTMRVAFFNVASLFPPTAGLLGADVTEEEFGEKLARLTDAIDRLMKRPDVIGVQEIGDSVPRPGGFNPNGNGTTSLETLQALATSLGGYSAYAFEGRDSAGIDSGFLIKDGVSVSGVTQVGLAANESIPGNCSDEIGFLFDRPPLIARLSKQGVPVAVLTNHWSSRAAPLACREAQADFVNDLVEAEPETEWIAGGDLNSLENETPLDRLQGNGTTLDNLTDKDASVPPEQRYSFQLNGRLQAVDHAALTGEVGQSVTDAQFAHFNSDYYDRLLEDPDGEPDGHKSSDHDPLILTLSLPPSETVPPPGTASPPPPATSPTPSLSRENPACARLRAALKKAKRKKSKRKIRRKLRANRC